MFGSLPRYPMKPTPKPDLVDVTRAAELLGVRPKTIRKMTSERRIPCVKLSSRCVRYDPAALAAWVETRSIKPSVGR